MIDRGEVLEQLDRLGRRIQLALALYDSAMARLREDKLLTRLALIAIFIAAAATFASERF